MYYSVILPLLFAVYISLAPPQPRCGKRCCKPRCPRHNNNPYPGYMFLPNVMGGMPGMMAGMGLGAMMPGMMGGMMPGMMGGMMPGMGMGGMGMGGMGMGMM